ncbi:response regulator [Marinilabiliaceae bacterium JC017]|nr:response regulator [Marinilabiliaceae bacterium JC017]
MKKEIILTAAFCFISFHVFTQRVNYRYGELSIEDGLSNNSISSILQDSWGFIWFGSYYGLNRYNGYEFETFYSDTNDSTTLSNSYVTSMLEDKEGDLWIGTKRGLSRFDKDTEMFTQYLCNEHTNDCLQNNHIGDVFSDSRGRIWVGTMGGGLHLFNEYQRNFTCFQQNDSIHHSINWISSIQEGYEGGLWIGTYGNGLSLFNREESFFFNYDFPGMEVNDLLDDGLGTIWVATNNMGLYRFDKEMKVYQRFNLQSDNTEFSHKIIMSLERNKDGNILVASDGGGILIVDPLHNEQLFLDEKKDAFADLDTKAIYKVFIDSNGLYWLGTIGKGVRILNMDRNRFYYYTHSKEDPHSLSDDAVISLLQDTKDRIWVGTDGGGLNLFDKSTGRFQVFKCKANSIKSLKSNVIKCLHEDRKGDLWIGTYGGGLNHFNPEKGMFEYFMPQGSKLVESLSVWSLAENNEKSLWVGTLGNGLFAFDQVKRKFIPLSKINPDLDKVMNPYILSLLKDEKGNLWIGTSNGVYVWFSDSEQFKHYLYDDTNESGVGNNTVISIYQDREGDMWFGTNGGGVARLIPETGKITLLTQKDGLAQERVFRIVEDKKGILWMATQGGVSQYNKKTGRFQNYDSRDGLSGNAFSTALYLKDGEIIAGGVKGLNIFDPAVIKINNNVPRVMVTKLFVNNVVVGVGEKESPLTKHISETNKIVLPYDQNNVGFEFIAINYFISEKNTYSYRFDGISDSWSTPVSGRIVKYNNLNPGMYVFKVKAANNDGVWSNKETEIMVEVKSPWWKTWWAITGYFVVFGLLIFAYLRYTLLWIDIKRRLEFEIMEREKIKELNHMRLQFFTNISHEFRTPLTLIIGPLENLMKKYTFTDESGEVLKVVHRNANVLYRLINQLLDFRKVETGSMELNVKEGNVIAFLSQAAEGFRYMAREKDIYYVINQEINSCIISFDADIVEKVVYNLLSNAFKYTNKHGEVRLNLGVGERELDADSKKWFKIEVVDTGVGIPEDQLQDVFIRYKQFKHSDNHQPGTGIGLALTKRLVDLHGGHIEVQSEVDKGSVFTVYLPGDGVIIDMMADGEDIGAFPAEVNEYPSEIIDLDDVGNKQEKVSSFRNHKILVVDDNEEVVNYLERILRDKYKVVTAFDGQDAWEKAVDDSFDLIVADVMMPRMDGIELCDQLKSNIQTSHIPVIILSARSSVENRIEGIKTGADAYIAKPFNADLLDAYIENLLNSRDKLKDAFSSKQFIEPSDITSTNIDEQFITKALSVVKENMDNENFGVEDLGQALGMSRSNLHRKLKAMTGKSTTDFIRTIRLKEAATLLLSSDLQISEIAYQVGFNSSSYFIKSFKKEFSMSPGQYKVSRQKWA